MAIRILSGENITGDITTSGKLNAGDRILTEATTSNALLQVKYNASNYLEAYYDTLNVVGGDFLIKRAGDTKIRLTAVGTTFTNLSNTSASSSSADEVKIGTFGAGRPAIFLGTSNTTYSNSTWFIENIGASGKFRIGRNGLDILEIENSGASTFKATSVTVLHASDPSVAVSDTDTNYKGIITWRNSGSENVLDFVTRYGGTYYTKNLVLDRGKVGIGTYTPETDLMIYDTVNEDPAEPGFATTGMFALNRSGQATLSMGVGANNSFWMSNVNRAFTGPNYYNISLNPLGGRVGIGTTSPGYKLQVSGVQNENDIVINNTATGINLRMQANNASANIFTTGALDLTLGTNNSTNVTVQNGGHVGINDTNPGHTLSVGGPAKIAAGLLVGSMTLITNFTAPYFTHNTPDLNVDLNLGNTAFWGHLEVTITGTYSNQNTPGKLTKIYAVGFQPGGTIYTNISRVSDAMGPVVTQINLGEVRWDSATSTYRIRIAHIASTGNQYWIQVKGFSSSGLAQSTLPDLGISSIYTQSTTGLLAQIPSFKTEMATFSAATGSTTGIISANSGFITSFATSATHTSSNSALFVPVANGIKITQAGLIQVSTNQDFISSASTGYAQVDIYKNGTVMFYSLRTNSNSQWDMLQSTGTMTVAANDVIGFRYASGNFTSMDTGDWSQYSFIWTSL